MGEINLKAALFDLDGTLFDTREVNYCSYAKAVEECGYHLDRNFFYEECNGKHYKTFIPLVVDDASLYETIHHKKKSYYASFLDKARVNEALFTEIEELKAKGIRIGLVTTASEKNTLEILDAFGKRDCFELILTQENVEKKKPDPEGYLKAMDAFKVSGEETVIYEDSKDGITAGTRAGAKVVQVLGYS